jgi:hypothetical protein
MTTFKRISITSLAVLLVEAASVTAHHIYETHLSSGYAPILRAILQLSHPEERAQYIHDAQVSVRTDEDREVEAKLEKLQDDLEENLSPACQSLQYTADNEQQKFYRAHAAYKRGGPGARAAYEVVMSDSTIKAHEAVLACIAADEEAKQVEVGRLWAELRATAGLPAAGLPAVGLPAAGLPAVGLPAN